MFGMLPAYVIRDICDPKFAGLVLGCIDSDFHSYSNEYAQSLSFESVETRANLKTGIGKGRRTLEDFPKRHGCQMLMIVGLCGLHRAGCAAAAGP